MSSQSLSDLAILQEASEILLRHLGASKTARFWALWQSGHGDYVKMRDKLFENETVDTLYEQIVDYQARQRDVGVGH